MIQTTRGANTGNSAIRNTEEKPLDGVAAVWITELCGLDGVVTVNRGRKETSLLSV